MLNLILILFSMSVIYIASTSRIGAYIKTLSMQGFLLFALVSLSFGQLHIGNFIFLTVETVGFKSILIPWVLFRIVRRNNISRETHAFLPSFYSVLIVSLMFAVGFYISYWAHKVTGDINPLHFGISIATIITGLFIIVSRKQLITHIMGFMILENGVFLLSLKVVKEMPYIVNIGILLDLFVAIILLGMFITRINNEFDEMDVDNLAKLKD